MLGDVDGAHIPVGLERCVNLHSAETLLHVFRHIHQAGELSDLLGHGDEALAFAEACPELRREFVFDVFRQPLERAGDTLRVVLQRQREGGRATCLHV